MVLKSSEDLCVALAPRSSGAGCSVAAIGSDAPRAGDELRDVFREGVGQFIDVLTAVSDGETAADRRRTAIARAAAMMGAMVMARAAASDRGSVG